MIYCFDTFYGRGYAKTAVVGIEDCDSSEPSFELSDIIHEVKEYESGAFYKRELPCLISIIKQIDLKTGEDILVIDGYVLLSNEGKLGLGGYLFKELEGKFPVIGVAKNDFQPIKKLKKAIYRGTSKKPLFITSLGIDLEVSCEIVKRMHGNNRIPTILKLVDQKSRFPS